MLSRKEKTDTELALQYGYSEEDIALLREYDGESIQENVELAALTGTLTIRKPTVITATSSRVVVRVVWRWDHCPVVNATDVFAVYWDSTFGSLNGNMRINISDSYHTVTYNLYDTYFTQTQSFTQVSPYSAAKVEFPMQDVSGEAWANKGEARLYFEAAEGSAALTEMDMIFAYGHTLVLLSPSISFPVSGGISFGWRTDEADRRSGYVSVADKTWVNN